MDENASLKEVKEASSFQNTLAASSVYQGSDKTDFEFKTETESQQATQEDETVSYPGGLKLFLLASVASSLLVRMNRSLNLPQTRTLSLDLSGCAGLDHHRDRHTRDHGSV